MAAKKKLDAAARAEIFSIVERRRQLTKAIRALQAEKDQLPNHKSLASAHGVAYVTIRRVLYGNV